ncbi:MAG: hypothetical protein AB2A00_03520 [Myxococcota bacterium]
MQTALLLSMSLAALSPRVGEVPACTHGMASAAVGISRTISLLELSVEADAGTFRVQAPASKLGFTLRAPTAVLPAASVRFSPLAPLRPLLRLGLKLELFLGMGVTSACGLDVAATEMPWMDLGLVHAEVEPIRIHPAPPQLRLSILTALERMRALDPSQIPVTASATITTGVQTTLSTGAAHAQPVNTTAAPRATTTVATPSVSVPRPNVSAPTITVRPTMRPGTEGMTATPRR